MTGKRKDSWTDTELNLLKTAYPSGSKETLLLQLPGRSWQSISFNARELGLKRSPDVIEKERLANWSKNPGRTDFWTGQEDEILKTFYRTSLRDEITARLPTRTFRAIRERAQILGLTRNIDLVRQDNSDRTRKALLAKYGVDSPLRIPEARQKFVRTNILRRGVPYPTQSPEVRNKAVETVRKKYGVDNVFQAEEIKKKSAETSLKKYGVRNPNQSPEIREKSRRTNLDLYGVENPFQMTDRVKEGLLEKYGQNSPQKVPEIREKTVRTNIRKYGTRTPAENPEIRKKTGETNLKRYGYTTPLQNLEIKDKIARTNLDKYGVENPAQSEPVKEKTRKTCLEKYGTNSLLCFEDIRRKGREKAIKNNSVARSHGENVFHTYLQTIDPKAEQHKEHPELKQVIDYYLPGYDLWVQYDGTYWHGKTKRTNNTRQFKKIQNTVLRDNFQNQHIPNLIRFWSDDVQQAIKDNSISQLIRNKIRENFIKRNLQIQF